MFKYDLDIKGVCILEQKVIEDNRGYFTRLFSLEDLNDIDISFTIKQINSSLTMKKGTIRGLHYQIFPFSEAKIFKCINGSFCHTFIDMREYSPTFLKYNQAILKSNEFKMLHLPEGIAHGMQSLEDNSKVIYFSSEPHHLESEKLINYADPMFNINWPIKEIEVSEKDKNVPFLNKNTVRFEK